MSGRALIALALLACQESVVTADASVPDGGLANGGQIGRAHV